MMRTILIVEDNEDCRKILELSLARIPGALVRAVATAEEALPHLLSGEVGALVTDLGLPQMNGYELIELFRTQSGCSKVPVIIVTADISPDAQTRAAASGANAFFTKPFYPSEIRQGLLSLIENPEAPLFGRSANA